MNKEELKGILPHREGMLLIDEGEIRDGVACGSYTVRGDEWFLQGHFPGFPIVPGVILCEILAQTLSVLAADRDLLRTYEAGAKDKLPEFVQQSVNEYNVPDLDMEVLPLFTGLDRVRFRQQVRPGDTVKTECRLTKSRYPFFFAAGKGYVGEKICVSAEFSFVVVRKELKT
jgi:3-hydroxyacyl-[acyl-carrier-protein] dehydratase